MPPCYGVGASAERIVVAEDAVACYDGRALSQGVPQTFAWPSPIRCYKFKVALKILLKSLGNSNVFYVIYRKSMFNSKIKESTQ